jgi:hypothetical protein
MTTHELRDGRATGVVCRNCGRPYSTQDGITCITLGERSLLGLRKLFAHGYATVPCPACTKGVDFKPAVMVLTLSTNSHVMYVHRGDALSEEAVRKVALETEALALADGLSLEVRSFETQLELEQAVLDRLRFRASVMTALNAANQRGELEDFLLHNWRTMTPEALVASDVVTLIERVLTKRTEARKSGAAYFSQHADQLGLIQAMTWSALCHHAPSSSEKTFEQDLNAFVDREVIFNTAVGAFEDAVTRRLAASPEVKPLTTYCLLALLAQLRKARGERNALEAEWTAAWMNFELAQRTGEQDVAARLKPLTLSSDVIEGTLARRTLFDLAGRTLAPHLDGKRPDAVRLMTRTLDEIGAKAGYRELMSDVFCDGLAITVDIESAAQAIELLDRMAAKHPELSIEQLVSMYCGKMLAAKDAAGVTAVFKHALSYTPPGPARAALESWYGSALLRMHQELLFLEHVGASERDWEGSLPDADKGRLWTERANALRAAGEVEEVLKWRQQVVRLYAAAHAGSRNHRQAIRALATAQRETGAPDQALALILPLLEDKQALDRVNMLDTASAIWHALGEQAKARVALEEGLLLAVGPDAHLRPHFATALATLQSRAKGADAQRALLESSPEEYSGPSTLLQDCVAWLNLLIHEHELSDPGAQRLQLRIRQLMDALAENRMPPTLREQGCIVLAQIAEQLRLDDVAAEAWSAAAAAADAKGLTPRPEVVTSIAQRLYRESQVEGARGVLASLPLALTRTISRVERIDVALNALTNLSNRLDVLTSVLWTKDLKHDARTVAEFRRDPLRRAMLRQELAAKAAGFLGGKTFKSVLNGAPAAVLEFIRLEDGVAPMLTWCSAGKNRILTRQLDAPDLDLFDLRDRIVNRLQGWTLGRPGNPFGVKHWPELRSWIRKSIDDAAPEATHLIVIETEGLEGVPFHVAVAPERSCSYSSSWMTLDAALMHRPTAAARLGCAVIPAFGDDPKVSASMLDAEGSMKALAAHTGLEYEAEIGAACDKAALTGLLQESDVCFVACHGFLVEERNEVAWVLACGGGLPSISGALVKKDEQAANHLSWREIEKLDKTPGLVVSAACSSGRASSAGLGDRIGLFQSLASRGARTLVAPAWDVEAELVLPIAARALQLHLAQKLPIAQAVRTACMTAEDAPEWCAWSLTVEGAWQ